MNISTTDFTEHEAFTRGSYITILCQYEEILLVLDSKKNVSTFKPNR